MLEIGIVVKASAPHRICDIGGWTDTWFAGYGSVLNIAVTPRVQVEVELVERASLHAASDNASYLVNAAIRHLKPPMADQLSVTVKSDMPLGAATGTSAAICTALVGALRHFSGEHITAHSAARVAHEIETITLGTESGIQDQLASAYGGISFINMEQYPNASVTAAKLPARLESELEKRLSLVYAGRPHQSSASHNKVIERLKSAGFESAELNHLRRAAQDARDALGRHDLAAFGRAMIANTDAQAKLHPSLVSDRHLCIIDAARHFGASGWKVNGAGGDGGSVTLLHGGSADAQKRTLDAIRDLDPLYRIIPITISQGGLHVWHTRRRNSLAGANATNEADLLHVH